MTDERAKKVCSVCGYPSYAGHSKACSTRTSESEDARGEGYHLFVSFLRKHGIDKMTQEEKMARLKGLEFNEVMQIISRMNGRLSFRDKRQEWTGKLKRVVVSVGGTTEEEFAELESLESAEELQAYF